MISGMIIAEASRRICATRGQQASKPGLYEIKFEKILGQRLVARAGLIF